jgi:hypothetical protein
VVKHRAGSAEATGVTLLMRAAGTAGGLADAVMLGLAAQVGDAGLDELLLEVGVHFHLSLVLSGGLLRACD